MVSYFYDSVVRGLFKTRWEREKVVVSGISSFFHNVFYSCRTFKFPFKLVVVNAFNLVTSCHFKVLFFKVVKTRDCFVKGQVCPSRRNFRPAQFDPFPNKPWFLRVCSKSLLKGLWEKEKLLVMSNFSFSHSVFYIFRELFAIVIEFQIVVIEQFQFRRVLIFAVRERVN